MEQLIFKQFALTRGYFLKTIKGINQEVAESIPAGFNNNILWHIGHVLTVTEQFMFGFPRKSTNIPESYLEWFGNGTKPSDWQGGMPRVDELLIQLEEQLTRIKEIPSESLDIRLKKPFMGFETFGELANMSLFHEAHHLGQIHTLRRLIKTSVKNPI